MQDFRFTPRTGLEQSNERTTKQSEQLDHRATASPDSHRFASYMEFPTGTTRPSPRYHSGWPFAASLTVSGLRILRTSSAPKTRRYSPANTKRSMLLKAALSVDLQHEKLHHRARTSPDLPSAR
jgi:hypothetical protein